MSWFGKAGVRAAAIGGAVLVVGQVSVGQLGFAAAAPASRSATAAEASPGWVTGVVVDREGDPIKGALVNALRPTEVPERGIIPARTDRRDWTNAAGEFRVRQGKGGYLIQICTPEPTDKTACKETAQGVDYVITYAGPSGVTDSWVLQTSLFEVSGTDRDLGSVEVKPQGMLHGTIENADQQLIALERLNGTIAYRFFTDEDGRYRMPGLVPGQYRVSAGGNGWLPWLSSVVTVKADKNRLVEDGIVRRGAGMHGVLRSKGEPVSYTDLVVRDSDDEVIAVATTDESGRYSVSGQLPGDYSIGIDYDGSPFLQKVIDVTLTAPQRVVRQDINVRRGAVLRVTAREAGAPARFQAIEMRDADGVPIFGGATNGNGVARFVGLAPGTYTYVIASRDHFVKRAVEVAEVKPYDLGTVTLKRATLTLSGTTAPKAVVEAMTGDQCPADDPVRGGSFHELEVADATGHYEIHGLVPGTYMLGSAGWPQNYVPFCESGVTITNDLVRDLPLEVGGTVSGRLVYASTGTPVITRLTYGLSYPKGSPGQPTNEQPSRALTRGASGEFLIDALGADTVTGQLLQSASDEEQINDEEFFVLLPYQDGTPYYLTSEQQELEVGPGIDLDLGDIELTLHQGP